jgi:hypothetical protein
MDLFHVNTQNTKDIEYLTRRFKLIITKETLEQSIKENEDFMEMVCEKKYGNKDKEKVI